MDYRTYQKVNEIIDNKQDDNELCVVCGELDHGGRMVQGFYEPRVCPKVREYENYGF